MTKTTTNGERICFECRKDFWTNVEGVTFRLREQSIIYNEQGWDKMVFKRDFCSRSCLAEYLKPKTVRRFNLTTQGDEVQHHHALVDKDGMVISNTANDCYNGKSWEGNVALSWASVFKSWKSSIQDNEYPHIEEDLEYLKPKTETIP